MYVPTVVMFDEHQYSPPNFVEVIPQNGQTNPISSYTSRGTKRKRSVVEMVEDQYEIKCSN